MSLSNIDAGSNPFAMRKHKPQNNYRSTFGSDFKLGFDKADLPVNLIGSSFHNDDCPSFVFRVNSEHYKLFVEYENPEDRENENDDRYHIYSCYQPYDDSDDLETGELLYATESAEDLISKINTMASVDLRNDNNPSKGPEL